MMCGRARSVIAGGPETKNARGFRTTGGFFLYRKSAGRAIFGKGFYREGEFVSGLLRVVRAIRQTGAKALEAIIDSVRPSRA
jgi:hypothetical protein